MLRRSGRGPGQDHRDTAGNRKRRLIRRLRLLRGRVIRCSTVMPDARPDIDIAIIETDIPVRLDRLPWTGFHTLVVVALGITWILDGLEVTLAGSIAGALQESPVLHFSTAEVGAGRQRLSRGRSRRRAVVRLPDRPVWPPQIVLCDLGLYLDGHRGHRICPGISRALRCSAC